MKGRWGYDLNPKCAGCGRFVSWADAMKQVGVSANSYSVVYCKKHSRLERADA